MNALIKLWLIDCLATALAIAAVYSIDGPLWFYVSVFAYGTIERILGRLFYKEELTRRAIRLIVKVINGTSGEPK